MRRLVRATAAFGSVLITSLLSLSQGAEAACRIAQTHPGVVHSGGEKTEVVAVCDEDFKTLEFLWSFVWTDRTGTHERKAGGGVGMGTLKNVTFNAPGEYEIRLSYGPPSNPSAWLTATLPITAAPAPPPVAAAKPPAPPPARVGFFDQVTFTPTSLTLRTDERGTASATRPTIGDPHIQWTLGRGTRRDQWTVPIGPIKKPGRYVLDAVVWDGNNMSNSRSFAIPITVIANALDVRLQTPGGKTALQLNAGGGKVPVVVTPQNGVPPYRLTVSVAGGASGSRNFDRQTQFNVSTTTPGSKTMTIAVVDAKGSTFNRTIPFSIAAAAPPPTSANPFKGSYEGMVTGPNPPNRYKYWAHVPNYDPDGTVHVSLYAFGDNYHVDLKGGRLTVEGGISGFKTSGTGSISGNGGVGTTITMQWTQTGSDGKPTPYTWVLKKYDDQDYQAPQAGYAR